jgi:ribonuclease G
LETLIINYTTREKRAALVKNKKVEKMVIDRVEQRSLVGSIFYGTVTKVLPGMNAAFIEIGEEKNAYLPCHLLAAYVLSDENRKTKEQKSISKFVHQGEKIPVQIIKDAAGTKGAKATGIVELQGTHLIYMPKGRYVAVSKKITDESKQGYLRGFGARIKDEDEGIIFRTSSMLCTEKELEAELNQLRMTAKTLLQQASSLQRPGLILEKDSFTEMVIDSVNKMKEGEVIVDDLSLKQKLESCIPVKNDRVKLNYYQQKENIFSVYRMDHEIEKLLKRIVWLENGAYLIFDDAEALTIVDVNTGKFSGKIDLEDTVVKTNQLAAAEIARQIRLRDLAGMILIDFIDMKQEKDKELVLRIMEQELKKDEKQTKLIGFTPLGILQLTRKKTRVSLSESLQEKCPVCEGTGRILSAETLAYRLERELFEHRHSEFTAVLVEATKEVKESFEGPQKGYQSMFEEAAHLKVLFQLKEAAAPFYTIKQFGDEEELFAKTGNSY